MKVLAAVCGVLIVLLGLWSTSRNPTEVQSALEILCLVGGLILCFLAVIIGRIDALGARLAAWELADRAAAVDHGAAQDGGSGAALDG